MPPDPRFPPAQEIYARWLDRGTRIAVVALAAAFLLYVFGLLDPLVPLDRLPQVWSLPVDRYVALTGAPSGSAWLTSLGKADCLNLAGIALLGLVSAVCCIRIVPTLLKQGERVQAAMALTQALVLLVAASGLFAGGH